MDTAMKLRGLLAMSASERFTALAWLCLRIAIAMILIGAVIGLFLPPGSEKPHPTAKPWIGPNAPTVIPAVIHAVVLGGGALLLLAGWRMRAAVVGISSLLIAVAVERLVRNPFTNLTADVGMILVLTLALLVAGPERDRWSVDAVQGRPGLALRDRWSWVTLFVRLLAGAIFFTQGFRNLFLGPGPIVFAERLYVKPFAGMMPEPLLWIAGVSNPVVQFGVGLLLILGLWTRSAAAVGALFLLSIIFGHLMEGPLTAPARMQNFATANFLEMIAIMILASLGNRWSLDAVLFARRELPPERS